jgi:hypothetical protein
VKDGAFQPKSQTGVSSAIKRSFPHRALELNVGINPFLKKSRTGSPSQFSILLSVLAAIPAALAWPLLLSARNATKVGSGRRHRADGSIAHMTRSIGRRLSTTCGDRGQARDDATDRTIGFSLFPRRDTLFVNKASTTISKPFKKLERGL